MRTLLPSYLVNAIDYVTGAYVPGAPEFAPNGNDEPDEEETDTEVIPSGVATDPI